MIIVIELLLIAVLLGWAILFIYTIRSGSPSVPTKPSAVRHLVALAEVKAGERAIDLGSGDGRLVVAFAKAGAEAHGYEINPVLVWWSRAWIRLAGLKGRAFVHQGSFWKVDLGAYDIIAIFGMPQIMRRMEKLAKKELKPGARIVSNIFLFPNWQPEKQLGTVRRYVREDPS